MVYSELYTAEVLILYCFFVMGKVADNASFYPSLLVMPWLLGKANFRHELEICEVISSLFVVGEILRVVC
jgi:hypothetical protein